VSESGGLSELRLFADQGGEDVATDAEGNVYIAAGDVLVYDRKGRSLGRIVLPRRAVQIAFGAPDGRTLFLCARDALYAVRMRVPGPTWPVAASAARPASSPGAP
jgi:sugar lactone lactonase YvrE